MSLIEAIVLGIVQGLTEFLPVSSSGHIEIVKALFNNTNINEGGLIFTVVLHFATALSTIIIYKKDILEILKGLLQFKNNDEFRFSLKIIISMIPAAIVGIVFNDQIEAFFNSNILLVGIMLIITALLLLLADKAKSTNKNVSIKNAFIIGLSQAVAILPGISRSGATISTAVLLGVDKEKAARFSFLMVVPLILGKMAKDLLDGEFITENINIISLSAGFITAFLTGLLACTLMIKIVKNSKLSYFSIYCFIVGSIAVIFNLLS
jgi:undecaprenyl-diphosphatase